MEREQYSLLRVNATDTTPSFEYIPKQGMFNVKGVSVPKDPKKFYTPILEWLDAFVKETNADSYLIVNVDLGYFSPSSLMQLIKVFRKLEQFPNASINWYYEDEDLQEAGEVLCEILKMRINLIKKN